jgi:hypothetical protein
MAYSRGIGVILSQMNVIILETNEQISMKGNVEAVSAIN